MTRTLTLTIAALVGLMAATCFVLVYQHLEPIPTGDTFKNQGFCLQVVSLFILGMYNGEILASRALGPRALGQGGTASIRRRKKLHMLALNVLGGAIFIAGIFLD